MNPMIKSVSISAMRSFDACSCKMTIRGDLQCDYIDRRAEESRGLRMSLWIGLRGELEIRDCRRDHGQSMRNERMPLVIIVRDEFLAL